MMRDRFGSDKKMPMGSVQNCTETAIESEAKRKRKASFEPRRRPVHQMAQMEE